MGPDPRGNRDVSSDDFLAAFGFRGVEFGLWLPDAERRAALNLGYDALHDLARAIGWEPRGLSLGGGLAVAFGARGSDRSPAHYEPGRAVMNLTRLRGAGYVAHEWGHAFDHWLGRLGGDEVEDGEPRFASGNGKHSGSRSRALPRLPGRLAGALDALVSAFRQRATTPGEALADARKALDESRVELAEIERTIASDSARVNGGWDGVEARTWAGWRTKWARLVGSLEGRIAALEAGDEVALPTRRSSFFENAIALSGSATGYYARPAELWARAFEAMVADRLAEAGERSDYLVSGVEEGYFAGPGFKGDPYPAGEERRRLSAMMFEIVDLARPLVPEPVRELVAPPGR